MVFLVDRNGVFKCKQSSLKGAGNGVFCERKVKAGTILPYYGIVMEDCANDAERDRTYVISADYTTSHGNQRTAKGLSVDGNPRLPGLIQLNEFKKLACQTNEASDALFPNCILVSNPAVSLKDIRRSLVRQEPIAISLLVVTDDLAKDVELLTCYGKDYHDRGYSPSKTPRKVMRRMIDRAHYFVDELSKKAKIDFYG